MKREWKNKASQRHREDGPAYISVHGAQAWYINGKNISYYVVSWMKENNIPKFEEWNDTHKVLFRLIF